MYISTTDLVRSGLTTSKANNIINILGKLVPIKNMQRSEPNSIGVIYMHNRRYVNVQDSIKALEGYLCKAPNSGNSGKIASIPSKKAMLVILKQILIGNKNVANN